MNDHHSPFIIKIPQSFNLNFNDRRISPMTTTKKKSQSHLFLFLQLIVSISIIACVLALYRIQLREAVVIRYDDDDVFVGNAKIAFLFLARASLPLDFIWHVFFEKAEAGNFSIYVHSKPGFVFDESTTRSRFFIGRHVDNSIQVGWGEASMIEAERMLLGRALEDPANQRFVFLSESCVPLYNFSYTYNYLMSSSKSFVDSFLDKKESRYNPKMFPAIPKEKWRKGSQWITLVRKHAKIVVADNTIFPIFKRHCKIAVVQKEHDCIPDEHYVQTLLSMGELEDELERRTLTYTSWNQSNMGKGKQSWHPSTFHYGNASLQRIKEIKDIDHVYYETEVRTEWCRSSSTPVPCFLFARKFSQGGAMRLLAEGGVVPYDASYLLLPSSTSQPD